MADYWTENADVFRRLYQDERKTLEQVKAFAERELHPPENYTLSTYETRLRDVLRLRKKLKQCDWYLIHHYALSRGYGRREYDVLLNGTQIRPDRVWKEIRRYGYHKETQCLRRVDLPKDVEVRPQQAVIASWSNTPSQTLDNSQMTRRVAPPEITTSSACNALQTWDAFSAALATIDTWTVLDRTDEKCPNENDEDLDHCKAIEMLHDDLPWNRLRVSVLEIMSGKKVAHRWPDFEGHFATYIPNDGFLRMTPGCLVANFAGTVYPTTSSLNALSIPSNPFEVDQLIWYHHFASIAFWLTDTQIWALDLIDFVEFGTALGLVHPNIILRIIQGHHVTIRAIWDRFNEKLYEAAESPRFWFFMATESNEVNVLTNACVGIIDTVLHTHPEWLETQDDANRLLMSCVWLRCKRLVLRLLRPGANIHYGERVEAITCSTLTHASEAGDGELIGALTKNVNMSAFIPPAVSVPDDALSHFAHFLFYMFSVLSALRSPVDVENVYQSLEHILTCGCGADVDGPYPASLQNYDQMTTGEPSLIQSWCEEYGITCLDAAFYFDRRAFQSMLLHTEQKPGDMTRQGVCEAATAGVQALDSYLSSRTGVSAARKSNFVQLVLAELFLLRPTTADTTPDFVRACLDPRRSKAARGLLQYGVRTSFGARGSVIQTLLLETCLASVLKYGVTDDLRAILMHFSEDTIAVRPRTLAQCVEDHGTDLLDFISKQNIISASAFRVYGSKALRTAVRNRNYEAVAWLVNVGVSVPAADSLDDTTIIGSAARSFVSVSDKNFFSICRYLIQHGAELKDRPGNVSCVELLLSTLRAAKNHEGASMACWHFFNKFPSKLAEISIREWRLLLEELIGRKLYLLFPPGLSEELFDRTADLDGKPSLVLAIQAQKSELVQTLLISHADIEERSPQSNITPLRMAVRVRDFRLARQIIDMGASLNAQVGVISRCCSALGSACMQASWSKNEKADGMRLIREMIRRGAALGDEHVSETARPWFNFPLYVCSQSGTLETATLLLQHRADPNLITISSTRTPASTWLHSVHTALDAAVELDRLDMTFLLLKAGGLSGHPGKSGYEGALRTAKVMGGYAVADMIQQHMGDLEREFGTDPGSRAIIYAKSMGYRHKHRICFIVPKQEKRR